MKSTASMLEWSGDQEGEFRNAEFVLSSIQHGHIIPCPIAQCAVCAQIDTSNGTISLHINVMSRGVQQTFSIFNIFYARHWALNYQG